MPERFIYALINFIILAAIVFVVFRKLIVRIFRTRREQINKDLDEAEAALAMKEPEPLTDTEVTVEGPSDGRIAALYAEASTEHNRRMDEMEVRLSTLRRDMLDRTKKAALEKLRLDTCALMAKEENAALFRRHERNIAHRILSLIKLTPGDITYLTHHDVLYVTLTSAFPLEEDLVKEIETAAKKLLDTVGGKPSFWVLTEPDCIGGLKLRIGDTVYDGTVSNALLGLVNNVIHKRPDPSHDVSSAGNTLVSDVLAVDFNIDTYQLGRVISISDGICWLDGLADIMFGELVEFENGAMGMIQDIEPNRIGCIIFEDYENIESGTKVRRVGNMASVPVGNELLGRVVDALGTPIDGLGNLWATETRPVEFAAPSITMRKSVSSPLHTGIKAIDALVPIGKGQRELIIGDRQTGKTSIALDAIINQKGKNTVCIYVAIGQKDTTVAEIYEKLKEKGAMEYTTIVCANASSSATEQYLAPFAGTAMGEHFMYGGRDVLIVYDDLSKHAVAYRELSLLLHRPSGREAYPGDVFYLHSRLLERSAKLSDEMGGGSMTALPIIETLSGDISAYIPTNAISITDGQIFLDTDLYNEGQRPAINVGLSVSRVGGAAQTPLLKQVAASLRMSLAQYRELQTFAQFGSDVDDDTRRVLSAGERMMAALMQKRYAPLTDGEIALIIFAVSEGFADDIPASGVWEFEKALFAHFKGTDILKRLSAGKRMDEEFKDTLKGALAAFVKEAGYVG